MKKNLWGEIAWSEKIVQGGTTVPAFFLRFCSLMSDIMK